MYSKGRQTLLRTDSHLLGVHQFGGLQAGQETSINLEDYVQTETEAQETKQDDLAEEEVIDIDLDDPEVNAAACKIQAGFKGMKARREVQTMRVRSRVVTL